MVYGEQRGAAVADFNEDGRVDLVVTQNGAPTRLFQNVTGQPGLRVRLSGPPGNPTGVGATLRLKSGPRLGPAREIHAGSGYWSQDSAIRFLAGARRRRNSWYAGPAGRPPPTTSRRRRARSKCPSPGINPSSEIERGARAYGQAFPYPGVVNQPCWPK